MGVGRCGAAKRMRTSWGLAERRSIGVDWERRQGIDVNGPHVGASTYHDPSVEGTRYDRGVPSVRNVDSNARHFTFQYHRLPFKTIVPPRFSIDSTQHRYRNRQTRSSHSYSSLSYGNSGLLIIFTFWFRNHM